MEYIDVDMAVRAPATCALTLVACAFTANAFIFSLRGLVLKPVLVELIAYVFDTAYALITITDIYKRLIQRYLSSV